MNIKFESKVNVFMYAFMYELEQFLSKATSEIEKISFHSDEANTDKQLKEFIKKRIEKDFNCIPPTTIISQLTIIQDDTKRTIPYSHLLDLSITRVFLPNELTNEIKDRLFYGKTAVYTNPDLCFEISDGTNFSYRSIELKSTRKDAIPGSSIQQIIPREWVIFIKHTNNSIEIATGQYIHTINSKIQFPDRSPRPQVSFRDLSTWNILSRKVQDKHLYYINDEEDEKFKYELINDWQTHLAKRWVNMLFTDYVKPNEPWFNNSLRKFILKFLLKYDELNKQQQDNFKKMIESLID